MKDIANYNRSAWNQLVDKGNEWTQAVTTEQVQQARQGQWQLVLTPKKPVPREWFGVLENKKVLCLASGGGQQGPLLAAAGAQVTVFDLSDNQLAQDQMVAERDGLDIQVIQGDMRNLSVFADKSFDLIFHPCSNCFIPDVQPVWQECYRVLKPGGELLAGFINPIMFVFDYDKACAGEAVIRHKLPYSDETHLSQTELEKLRADNEPFSFSHSLEQQIAGQLKQGFKLVDMYEDNWPGMAFSDYLPTMLATRAVK